MHPDLTRSLELQLCAAAFAHVHANQQDVMTSAGDTSIACTYSLNLPRLIAWYKTLDTDLVRKMCEDDNIQKSVFGYKSLCLAMVIFISRLSAPPCLLLHHSD
jgi:hypothetical protein